MDKNREILKQQKKQNILKAEIKVIKKKIPTYLIGFVFFVIVSLYFLEDKFYHFFGNSVDVIIAVVVLLSVFSLLIVIRFYIKIKQKQKEAKAIGSKLYKLMKLDAEANNE